MSLISQNDRVQLACIRRTALWAEDVLGNRLLGFELDRLHSHLYKYLLRVQLALCLSPAKDSTWETSTSPASPSSTSAQDGMLMQDQGGLSLPLSLGGFNSALISFSLV